MAEARQIWAEWLVSWAFLIAPGATVAQSLPAQSPPPRSVHIRSVQSGSLAGRLTDLRSAPLQNVSLVLRNQTTGAELHATTGKNGAFRFTSLDSGVYTLEADTGESGQAHLEGIFVTAGTEARLQAAIQFEPVVRSQAESPAQARTAEPSIAARVDAASSGPAAAPVSPAKPALAIASPIRPPDTFAPSQGALAASFALPDAPRVPSSSGIAASISAFPSHPVSVSAAPGSLVATKPPQPVPPLESSPPAVVQPPVPAPTALHIESNPIARPEPSVAPAHRAELDTQSTTVELVLAAVPSRALPLPAGSSPTLAAGAALPSGTNADTVDVPPLTPIAAAAGQPNPAIPVAATTLTSAQLQALPAGGRRWQEFLLDTPASSSTAGSSQESFRASQQSSEIAIDGANTRMAFGAAAGSGSHSSGLSNEDGNDVPAATAQSWTGGRGLGVSEAAVREVTAAAGNVEAEGFRSAGGRTAVGTLGGADALHGQSFLFDRQNTWGAQNPFTQWVQNTGSSAAPNFTAIPFTPPDHETVWGLGMGSRIRRDGPNGRGGIFWFAALDNYLRNDPGLATVKHPGQFFAQPSNAQMQLLSAQLGLSSANPVAEGLAAYWQTLETLDSLLGPAPRTASQWTGFARIDWHASERHRLTLEGIGSDWNAPGGGIGPVSADYGNRSFGSRNASNQWQLARWEAYLTPNLLSVTQGSTGRSILSAHPDAPSSFEQLFLSGNAWGQLPQIVVDSRYGFTIGNPSRFGQGSYPDERLYHGQQMVDWVHNRVLIGTGFELDHDSDATTFLRNQTGAYHYSTVANFVADASAFQQYGLAGLLDPSNPHNCDATGKPWYATNGQLMGLGSLPCYSYYSQTIGPSYWHLSTNDWAGFLSAQWQPARLAVVSAGLRWEREQMPPPIAMLSNPQLPLTQNLPALGNNWGPRFSFALGSAKGCSPVLRLGYGIYYGRTENATVETALTQTGSLNGDLNFFMRPSDDCQFCSGGAPAFPYVLAGRPASVVVPSTVQFAPHFRNPEVHQAIAAVEQPLPSRVELTAGAMLSLGRRLPVSVDTNLVPPAATQTITYNVCDQTPYAPPGATSNGQSGNTNGQCGNLGLGPIKATQITLPFYASWPQTTSVCPYYKPTSTSVPGRLCPDYQQIDQIESRANSTYEAAIVKLARDGRRGLNLRAHYTYAHATDWNPSGVTLAPGNDVLDPANFSQEYGTSNLDVRHSAAVMAIFETPWKLRDFAGRIANGWALSGIGQFHSGLPYTMRVTGSLPEEFTSSGAAIVGLGPSINGSGGDSRVYGLGNDGQVYNIGRNTFRYPDTWKADLRLAKRFNFGDQRQLELMAETFNLFNHQNVTELETTGYSIQSGTPPDSSGGAATPPSLTFLTGLYVNPKTGLPSPAFGQPLNIDATDFYRERQIQLGARIRF